MNINASNRQISKELKVSEKAAQKMATKIRKEVDKNSPKPQLPGEIEFDEVYVVASHKRHPKSVKKRGRSGRRRRLEGARRGALEKEKPPIFGMIQRGGEVVIQMLSDVKQKTIKPITEEFVSKGSKVHTDEYDIYSNLTAWGYNRPSVCHSKGEYARNEDGDGFHEIQVNIMEGFWSLLRS